MWPNPQSPADLVRFTVKILNKKQFLHDVPYVTYGDPLRGQVERNFNPRLNQLS